MQRFTARKYGLKRRYMFKKIQTHYRLNRLVQRIMRTMNGIRWTTNAGEQVRGKRGHCCVVQPTLFRNAIILGCI